jgi:hypothetical protein
LNVQRLIHNWVILRQGIDCTLSKD